MGHPGVTLKEVHAFVCWNAAPSGCWVRLELGGGGVLRLATRCWGLEQFVVGNVTISQHLLVKTQRFHLLQFPSSQLPNCGQEAKAEVGVSCSETCLDRTLLCWGVCSHMEDPSTLHPVFFLTGCSITAVSSPSCARPSSTKSFARRAKGWATCGRWSCCSSAPVTRSTR